MSKDADAPSSEGALVKTYASPNQNNGITEFLFITVWKYVALRWGAGFYSSPYNLHKGVPFENRLWKQLFLRLAEKQDKEKSQKP